VHRRSTELGDGIFIPLCTTGLVWGSDSWFTGEKVDDPSVAQVDVYFHILKENGIVYLCLTNEAGKPSMYVTGDIVFFMILVLIRTINN